MTALFVLDFVSIAAGQLWFVCFFCFFSKAVCSWFYSNTVASCSRLLAENGWCWWVCFLSVFLTETAVLVAWGGKGKERWWQGFSAPNKVKLFQSSSFCSPGFAGSPLSLITSHSRPSADIIWSVYADDFSVVVFSLCSLLRSLSLSHFFRSTSPNGVYTRSWDSLYSSFLPSVCFFFFVLFFSFAVS